VGRRSGGDAGHVLPVDEDVPEVGVSNPPIMRSTVDLPEPDGPRRQTNSPSATDSVDARDGGGGPKDAW
jgi:hypothetical protein